jgi:hypothetical protein
MNRVLFVDAEGAYKLFAPAADALAAVLQRMQLCFFGSDCAESAARQADSIIHHLQQDLVGNLCTILQAAHGAGPAPNALEVITSVLQVCHPAHLHPGCTRLPCMHCDRFREATVHPCYNHSEAAYHCNLCSRAECFKSRTHVWSVEIVYRCVDAWPIVIVVRSA